MSQISIQDLTFCYEGSYDPVFEHVSFRIDTDWKLGFTGRNGCGKTTFLKLLTGELDDRGSITRPVSFDYFPFEVSDRQADTQEVAALLCPDAPVWKVIRELSLLGMGQDVLKRPFGTLSNGEQTKVLLALLFLKENNFLLVDEPTNHLDSQGRKIVGDYLNQKSGFILVSHDRAFLDGCIDHILSVNRTNIEIQSGNFTTWMQNKQRQEAFEKGENEKLKKQIKRLSEDARQKERWAGKVEKSKKGSRVAGLRPDRGHIGHMAEKMMKRVKTAERRAQKAVEEKSSLLRNVEYEGTLAMSPLTFPSQRLAYLKDVCISYDGSAVCSGVGFEVSRGDRVALSGKNGCGKSSILKLLCGESIPHTGTVQLSGRVIVSYVPQDPSFLRGSMNDFVQEAGIDRTQFLTVLRKFAFSRTQFEKDMRDLSAGQKKKVLLAKSLCEQAHLYIWDEPLNYVDVVSRIQIEEVLRAFQPTMLLVEHDVAFDENIVTKRILLE